MKKNKITVSANLENEKKIDPVFLLKKEYSIDTLANTKKEETFLLKKNFQVIENKNELIKNTINLNNKNTLLEIKKISKSFSKKPILKNISLNLEPGKIVGLLGPNGSGKTTLFNLIIGKIFPDQGSIIFNNEIINNLPIHLRSLKGISLLEQHKGLFGNMTAYDNLYAILELHIKEKAKIDEKIKSLLGYFDLNYLKDTKANFLSGGEYKKVSILQRICNPNISILLLDEPCAALDPLSINSLKQFIIELKKIGLSILITDHNYWAIESILDKAYLIKDGQILVEGSPSKISNDKDAIKYYLGSNFRF
jgi:lipopolysaccharide export system ATP-binding protein